MLNNNIYETNIRRKKLKKVGKNKTTFFRTIRKFKPLTFY